MNQTNNSLESSKVLLIITDIFIQDLKDIGLNLRVHVEDGLELVEVPYLFTPC